MIFPFDALNGELRELGLFAAVLIGFCFGFVLERAGFGRANKLAAQFYLYDMTVFKVMFGAIVTAMLGMVVFSELGLVNMREVADAATSGTYLWPMVVGGFVLGLGFVTAGYCPGTSIVAAASGNIDGVFAFVGVTLGTYIYSEVFPLLSKFHNSTDLGHIYLYDILGVPAPIVALGIAAMAVVCFFGAEKVEKIFRKKLSIPAYSAYGDEAIVFASAPRRFAFSFFLGAAVLGVLLLALPPSPSAQAARNATLAKINPISQESLAQLVLEEPWKIRLLDVRAKSACESARIPGSECVPLDTLSVLNLKEDTTGQTLVFVSSTGLVQAPAEALPYAGAVLLLTDGFEGWKAFALTQPEAPAVTASDTEKKTFRLRSSLYAAMTGIKQLPPPPPRAAGSTTGGKKKGGGCSG